MAYSSTILDCLQNLTKSTSQLCPEDNQLSEIRPFKRRLARNSEIARLQSYCENVYNKNITNNSQYANKKTVTEVFDEIELIASSQGLNEIISQVLIYKKD